MELRSTGNPDTSNSVTMSMLEYLRKKGIEAMSGICKYPKSVCPHMTVLKGKSYCDATPCQLTGELPKRTNADRIREMGDEELAKFIDSLWCNNLGLCEVCPYRNMNYKKGMRKKKPNEMVIEWLKQTVED